MIKYSEDKKVFFKEDTHSYFLGDKRLKSVTSYLSEFKNEFDSDKWSKIIAEREGKTQDEILLQWKEKAKKSCDIGTATHKIFEDYTLKNYSLINNEYSFEIPEIDLSYMVDFNKKYISSIQFIKDFFETKRLIPIHTEYIVYNDILAGQVDMICKDQKDNYYILDFKTNEEISTNSYHKKMKGIFKDIDDCAYYHYTLQLSIYRNLLKKYNIKKTFLIHIKDDGYNFIETHDIIKEMKLKTPCN